MLGWRRRKGRNDGQPWHGLHERSESKIVRNEGQASLAGTYRNQEIVQGVRRRNPIATGYRAAGPMPGGD